MFVIKNDDGTTSVVGSINHAQLAELGIDEHGNKVKASKAAKAEPDDETPDKATKATTTKAGS